MPDTNTELIEIDSSIFIQKAKQGVTKLEKTYRCGEKVFRIKYENSNGFPIGFNYKKCLAQYNGTEWKNLEDINALNGKMDETPSYFSEDSHAHCLEFFKLMEKRIVNIYS